MPYTIMLRRNDEGYSVSCPELPGCWFKEKQRKKREQTISTRSVSTWPSLLKFAPDRGAAAIGRQTQTGAAHLAPLPFVSRQRLVLTGRAR
jgi:hypothetical protein